MISAINVNINNFYNKKMPINNNTKVVEKIPFGGVDTFQPTSLPSGNRNYALVDPKRVEFFVNQKENALPYLSDILMHSNNETQVTETLYIIDRMLDNGVQGIDKMYPVLARFNNTKSPNIQTYLAGIYRKTQVPDAFGPLVKMLIRNSLHPQISNFDPNEEIGGAILEYIRSGSKKSI
jgi:hypothetical protein